MKSHTGFCKAFNIVLLLLEIILVLHVLVKAVTCSCDVGLCLSCVGRNELIVQLGLLQRNAVLVSVQNTLPSLHQLGRLIFVLLRWYRTKLASVEVQLLARCRSEEVTIWRGCQVLGMEHLLAFQV